MYGVPSESLLSLKERDASDLRRSSLKSGLPPKNANMYGKISGIAMWWLGWPGGRWEKKSLFRFRLKNMRFNVMWDGCCWYYQKDNDNKIRTFKMWKTSINNLKNWNTTAIFKNNVFKKSGLFNLLILTYIDFIMFRCVNYLFVSTEFFATFIVNHRLTTDYAKAIRELNKSPQEIIFLWRFILLPIAFA